MRKERAGNSKQQSPGAYRVLSQAFVTVIKSSPRGSRKLSPRGRPEKLFVRKEFAEETSHRDLSENERNQLETRSRLVKVRSQQSPATSCKMALGLTLGTKFPSNSVSLLWRNSDSSRH